MTHKNRAKYIEDICYFIVKDNTRLMSVDFKETKLQEAILKFEISDKIVNLIRVILNIPKTFNDDLLKTKTA